MLDNPMLQASGTAEDGIDQCRMGALKSNLNWIAIKKAFDEQDIASFLVVEREGFYDEQNKCSSDDCA